MRTRTWIAFIAVNVIVSATVMLLVLTIWNRVNDAHSANDANEREAADITISARLTPSLLPNEANEEGTPAAPAVAPSPAPAEQHYVVQPGDTLLGIAGRYGIPLEELMRANGISDPNLLQAGQTLVIPTDGSPEPPALATTSPTPTSDAVGGATLPPALIPTITPSGEPVVQIGQVLGSGELAGEVVVIRNLGGLVNLSQWTLSDAAGNVFTFPDISLFPNVQMRIHSTGGRSTPSDLYWGRETPAWDGGELITLRDAQGNVIDTYIVP